MVYSVHRILGNCPEKFHTSKESLLSEKDRDQIPVQQNRKKNLCIAKFTFQSTLCLAFFKQYLVKQKSQTINRRI